MNAISKPELEATIDAVKEIVSNSVNSKSKRDLIIELDRVIHPVAIKIRTRNLVDNPVAYKYGLPYPREFYCRYCHRYCYISARDLYDHRSVFCSAKCEREYWRKVTKHPTNLTNHKPGMYQRAEKIENKRDSVEALEEDVKIYNALNDGQDDNLPEVANKALKEYQNER